MKKVILCLASFMLSITITFNVSAESIRSNDITLEIFKDGNLKIEEKIVWGFDEGVEKHGIIREIPLGKVPGSSKNIEINNFNVVDENGQPYNFSKENDSSVMKYKIGDIDTLVSGDKNYIISYDIKNSLGYFKDFTEIYWNIVGTGWIVPTGQVSASVTLPEGVNSNSIKVYCGYAKQKEECATYAVENNIMRLAVKEEFLPFPPGYGLTVAVAFPRGFISSEPTESEILFWKILRYLSYVMYGVPLFVLYLIQKKRIARRKAWKKYVRSNPELVQYDSDKFSPLQAGIIYNEGNDGYQAISSEIVFLIAEGYLEAKEDKDGQTVFTRLSRDDGQLLPHQKILLTELAGKAELDLKLSFLRTVIVAFDGIVDNLKHRNVFEDNALLRIKSLSAHKVNKSGALLFISLFLAINPGIFIYFIAGWYITYIWSTSCVLIGLTGLILKNKYKLDYTEEGLRAKWHISGLYKYIDMAEKDKIVFDSDPEKKLEIAEKLLPYAMVFGMEKKWIAYLNKMLDMSGLAKTDIEKYNNHSSFLSSFAAQSLLAQSFSTSALPAPVSSSGSGSSGSSGGSSGGGGGGGGGGSW